MFTPPRCPNESCPEHSAPTTVFYVRCGFYRSSVKPHPIPRFRCKTCRRGFSRQTFRHDYHDKKPHLNAAVIRSLCAGVGYRESARNINLTRRNLTLKAQKIQRTAALLDRNLLERAGVVDTERRTGRSLTLQFDEFETYEMCRNTMPLSVPTAVESDSRLILGAIAAPIRPRGKMTEKRIARIERHAARYGAREDRSTEACLEVLKRAAAYRPSASIVRLDTDFKSTYSKHARSVFGRTSLLHMRTLGSEPRDQHSRLAAINLTEAMMRDLTGRVRRESWLVSKKCEYLNLHLGLYCARRNWVRPRFNRDAESPGQIAGFARRRLRTNELVGWRQDWKEKSPSPFGGGMRSVAEEWSTSDLKALAA